MSSTLVALIVLIAVNPSTAEGRWSRQLSSESSGDWVPLEARPSDNEREGRVLAQTGSFQSNFFPTDSSPNEYKPQETPRQLFLQSVPAGQAAFPPQPNQPLVQLALTDPRYPFAQAFVPRSIQFQQQQQQSFPQYQQQLTAGQIIQHPSQINNQFYNHMKMPQFLQTQPKPLKQEVRLVDGYKVENASIDYYQNAKKKPTNLLVKTKQEYVKPEPVLPPRATERASSTLVPGPTTPAMTTVEKEEVQLLYVPLESLKRDQKQYFKMPQQQESLRDSIGSPVQINNQLYTPTTPNYVQRQQTQLQNIQQELIQQAFNTQNLQNHFKQTPFDRPTKYQPSSSNIFPSFSQTLFPKPDITTPKSKKLKAHQPPLAIYMINKSQDNLKLTDVLHTLKDAKGISVLDNIGPDSPSVFVGPNNLRAPTYYSKFELPYLSSIDGNRIQRNIDRLPFFVAPLSYKAPQGFAKIPFPAPHVGSVIINPFMNEAQDSRPAPLADVAPSSFAYTTFQQNPTTESFRSTVTGSSPLRQSTVNYFPSATPNPSLSHSTIPGQFSSFLPFDTFSSHRPPPPSKKPEPTILTSSRQPLTSYFSTTPSKPTVSYFSFSGPDYTTIPTRPSTTTRTPTTQNYFYRGHYITNAADPSQNPLKIVTPPKDVSSERPHTTPIPTSGPTLPSENPYLINHIIQQTQEQEDVKNFKTNEVQEYNTEKQQETPTFNTFSSYIPERRPVENVRYSTIDGFSPIPSYFGPTSSVRPNEVDISSVDEEPEPHQVNEEINKQSLSVAQYQFPSAEDDNSNIQYQTEAPTTQRIITTTTTTTQAPTTKSVITRRPIHLRGRTRTTTPKPEVTEPSVKPTTRRTPLRERRPSTYKSRFEKTTTEASATESSNFESAKRSEAVKSNRYSYRNRGASSVDEETKTTTESTLPKTSAAARNQRLRSRGKTHFKSSDNYEGSDYVPKKSKGKDKESEGDIAYQRDVLHQNYPVTIVERMSTLEVRTTPLPSTQGIDLTNGKIRIYETTGNTQRSYLLHDAKPSEAPEAYDNQPVFQGEEQKYLTQPDTYVEVSSERIGGSSIMPELFINSRDSSVKDQPSSSENYDKIYDTTVKAQIKQSDAESELESVTQYQESIDKYEPTTIETPIARFRNKLRSRPKHIAVTVSKDGNEETSNHLSIDSKKVEEHTENHLPSTRRSSAPNVSPITYRPSYNRHQTTMRIEEIEAELKSNRHQLKSSLHPTTSRHPVYIPESSSSSTSNSDSDKEEPTTKRNHFSRRRPVRPTAAPSSSNYRQRTTTEPTVESTTLKRVRVRGRIRTRPTTTEKTELKNEEEIQKTVEAEEKPSRATERTSVKYSTRGRLATQKYFKRPVSATEKNPAISQEVTDDQASYDSINRPEYVEYKSSDKTLDDYNPENGKAETQWSPKLSHSSFRPIFNPNLIADEIKQDGVEYGSKLSANSGDDEIITARSPYEDVLISVTPSSNTIDLDKSSVYENIYPSTTFKMLDVNEEIEKDKKSDAASTFESVLEEVMRNLEQQDEDEYNSDYGSPVMKHEGGEIGAIPPENYQTTRKNIDLEPVEISTESKKVEESPFDTSAFSSDVENKYTTSTTERQSRRRGVWRKVKRIRPIKKNNFETAESQYYGNSNNDLLKIKDTLKETIASKNNELKKEYKSKDEPEQIVTTEKVKDETTIAPTMAPEAESVTEAILNLADMDLGTGSPDMLMLNMFNEKVTSHEDASLEDQKEVAVQQKNESISADTKVEEASEETLFVNNEAVSEKLVQNLEDDSDEETIVNEEVKDALAIPTTTEIPMENPTEYVTEAEEITTKQPEDEQPEPVDSVTEKEDTVITKIESVENTTPGLAYWDPMNIISTSKSTEISHETEICYRGRCIKTKKDHNILL